MVDTVLFLEGEKNTGTRILRSLKNVRTVTKFGIFAMQEGGMEEIKNPEQIFLPVINARVRFWLPIWMGGQEPFLVEVRHSWFTQNYGCHAIVAAGVIINAWNCSYDLTKHARLPVEQMDVFVNVAGE